ncbi:MAG: YesL family protein [Acholeplasmataceae bacterium]
MKEGFKEFYQKLTDVLYVHVLWLLTSFLGLLITFGAATTALFKVMFQILKKDEPTYVSKLFFETFKKDFIESTLVWILIIFFAIPLTLMTNYAFLNNNGFLMVISVVAIYQLALFVIYAFPVIAVFKSKSILETIKNTLLLLNVNLITNLKVLGSFAVIILGYIYLSEIILILILPTYGFLIAFHLKAAFIPYINKLKNNDKGEE